MKTIDEKILSKLGKWMKEMEWDKSIDVCSLDLNKFFEKTIELTKEEVLELIENFNWF